MLLLNKQIFDTDYQFTMVYCVTIDGTIKSDMVFMVQNIRQSVYKSSQQMVMQIGCTLIAIPPIRSILLDLGGNSDFFLANWSRFLEINTF